MFSWLKNLFPKEFSQKLATTVTIVWVLSIIVSFIVMGCFGIDLTAILSYVQTAFLGVLAGYFTKAGIENFKKISQSVGQDSTNSTNGDV